MKFQILNNEELGFFDDNGNKTATISVSGSNLILNPSGSGDILLGNDSTVNDVEMGIPSTPSNFTYLGGLPTSDPGVYGRLFQTSSEAIGASAGFQVVLISQG
jgi:hypothetical protein